MNGLLQVFGDGAHVQRDDNSAAQRVPIEEGRLDPQLVALDVFLDEPDYLCKQIFSAPLPSSFHLFIDVTCGREHNLLCSESLPELTQTDFRYLSQVGLAINRRSHLSQCGSLVGVEYERLCFF